MAADLTADDLGLALGCSAKNATLRLHRARRRLAEALAEGAADPALSRPFPIIPTPAGIVVEQDTP
jgi:hypothetical protein